MDPALLRFYLHIFKNSLGTSESTDNMKDVTDDSSVPPDPDQHTCKNRHGQRGLGLQEYGTRKLTFNLVLQTLH